MARAALENIHALIVDDSPYMRELLSSILLAFGTRSIRCAASASDGMHLLEKFKANVAIVDWMMKPIDGMQFVKNIRQSTTDRVRKLPIIMLTGHADAENIATAKEAGANSFLGKPFTPNSLYDQIVHVIESPNRFTSHATK